MWLLSFLCLRLAKELPVFFQAQQAPLFAGRLLASQCLIFLVFPYFLRL